MTTVLELDADTLAEHAFNMFLAKGRTVEGARLIYQALRSSPHHVDALRCLSDFMAQPGTESFAGVTLAYALSDECGLDEDAKKWLDDIHFVDMWSWGFAKHVSGAMDLEAAAFEKREDFVVDQVGYDAFIDELVGRAGSLLEAYHATLRLCGVFAGFLRHRNKENPNMLDLMEATEFEETLEYASWLATKTDSLNMLREHVDRMRAGVTS